jgi:hypothetical protein
MLEISDNLYIKEAWVQIQMHAGDAGSKWNGGSSKRTSCCCNGGPVKVPFVEVVNFLQKLGQKEPELLAGEFIAGVHGYEHCPYTNHASSPSGIVVRLQHRQLYYVKVSRHHRVALPPETVLLKMALLQ